MPGRMTTPNDCTESSTALVTVDPEFSHPNIRHGRYLGPKPSHYLALSIFSTLVNPVLGPIAIFFSWKSSASYDAGDAKSAKRWGDHAFRLGLGAVVLSIQIAAVLIFALVRLQDSSASTGEPVAGNENG